MINMGKLSNLLKLKPFIKKYYLIFWAGIVGMIFCSIIATPVPYIIGTIMDKVLIGEKSYKEFYIYIGVIAVLYILRYIIAIASQYMFVKINNLVVNEMRYTVMEKVIALPMNYLSNTEKGYVQSRIAECSSIGNVFSPGVVGIFLSIFDAVLAIVTMFSINYKLAIVILILAPIFFFASKTSAEGFMKSTKDMLESSAILNGESFEIINGIEDIKVLNGKRQHLSKFKSRLGEVIKSSIKQSKSMILFIENITAINDFGSLLVLFISGIMILKGNFTIGLYTSFSLYMAKVFSCTQGLATIGTTLKPVCLSIERLYELLDMKDENSGRSEKLNGKIEKIKFDNVNFKYNENSKEVLNSLSLHINKGEKVLIKGENGSGKSTIIKLLLGLYTPAKGQILYNDIDSAVIDIKSIRERISIVSQNIFLFKGTVLDNILYGQNEKNRKDVEKLIDQLKLQEYINRFPQGLDTEIVQNTAGVSGGQAQVIAFIRALLSQKDVIILDEPISNVDAETRDIILEILEKRDFNGILIVVSHFIEGMDFINRTIEI